MKENQNNKGGIFDDDEDVKPKEKPILFSNIKTASLVAGLFYIFSYSFLLVFSFKCGKFNEYGIPLQFIEFSVVPILVLSSVFIIISLSSLVGIILSLKPNEKIKHRTKKLIDFFVAISTLVIGTYFALAIYSVISGSSFPLESIYAIIVYLGTLAFYFLPRKSYFADSLIVAGFIITLVVSAYYIGISSARMENRMLVNVGGQTYSAVSTYKDNLILVGYNKKKQIFNSKTWLMNLKNKEAYDFYIQKK